MTTPGTLFIIAAPSGAGKTSLVKALAEQLENLCVSISHTTRPKRPSEQHAHDYFFVDHATFDQMLQQQAFLEHATVFHHAYGTSKSWVNERLSQGKDVILEIDWQGAAQVKQQHPASVAIFIVPPSIEALSTRLRYRGQDNENTIADRMKAAKQEISHQHEFDYLIINDDFTTALSELTAIIHSHRLKQEKQEQKHSDLLANLLQ